MDLDAAGTNAGKVWVALNTAKKPLTLAEISKNTGLCETCTAIALGWLAREAKVKGVDKFELYAYE
ncbi:MAG: winged helix-turn-helix domain-containing protein [Bacteroidaceae bacterium]|nr:winged helix-turn-helix domain-containing protein [Bacteroidaceae bacterium]